jgi:hypothetical protein
MAQEAVPTGKIRMSTIESELICMVQFEVRFIRPDIAIVDIDCGVFGSSAQPPGVQAGADGALRACPLLVLVKESGSWWIAAYHNVWRATVRFDSTGKA